MDPVGQKLLELAKKELGYSETSSGYTKFGDWWTKNVDEDQNPYFKTAPWCEMFWAKLADEAGLTAYLGEFASTQKHAEWFKDHDAWSTKPEPGALVYFSWSGGKDISDINHVEVVLSVDGDTLTTIGANRDDAVVKGTRSTDNVVGYGHPGKVEVNGVTFAEAAYTPKHSAPVKPEKLDTLAPPVSTSPGVRQETASTPEYELPIKEAALTGMIGLAVLSVIAVGVAKVAAAKGAAAVAAAPEVRVRKRGRHHRTSGAPAVEMPVGMTHYDFDDAEAGTLMMPAITAEIAQKVEDQEFWGRIAHLEEDDELSFWNDVHSAVSQNLATNAQLTGAGKYYR